MCEHGAPTFMGVCVVCVADSYHYLGSLTNGSEVGECAVCGITSIGWSTQGPYCKRARNFTAKARNYGGREAIRDLYLVHDGQCAICGIPEGVRALSVDHDHACCESTPTCGNCNRGLLCHRHNLMVGYVEAYRAEQSKVDAYLDKGRLEKGVPLAFGSEILADLP